MAKCQEADVSPLSMLPGPEPCGPLTRGAPLPPRGVKSVGLWWRSPRSRGVGRRTTQFNFLGAFRRPRGSLRRRPRGLHPCSPRPDRSGTFGDFGHPRPSALPAALRLADRTSPDGLSPLQADAFGRLPSADPSSRRRSPAVVRGGRISDGRLRLNTVTPEPASRPPSPGFGVNPGRRRRPRPTSRRLMSAPLGWTGRGQASTSRTKCQGLFSGTSDPARNAGLAPAQRAAPQA